MCIPFGFSWNARTFARPKCLLTLYQITNKTWFSFLSRWNSRNTPWYEYWSRLLYSKRKVKYEGCSNMNASGFITFFTYMLRQNGKRFYKGLYVTFKLVPDVKTNTVYLSSYSPWNKGHVSILTNLMLWTFTSVRRAYNSSINWWNFLEFWMKFHHVLI